MKQISLKYGSRVLPFNFPDALDILRISEPEFENDRLRFYTTYSSNLAKILPQNLSHTSKIAVVVADKTRLCQYPDLLPILVQQLELNQAHPSNIVFYIAYGTHAPQTNSECRSAYGDIFLSKKFIHHDCRDLSLFVQIGQTERKTPVRIRKDLLDSDLIITFGAVSHHYFAGFGGGRKLLFPGLGYIDDIYHNHSLFLDLADQRLHPGCRPGQLENNPISSDLKEIYDLFNVPQVNIHGILDSRGRVCQLLIGNGYDHFLSACNLLDTCYRSISQKKYNTVIASCGGYPKDINFIQSHKAINNAALFLKDGGNLIILAECKDNIGSDTFIEYFNLSGFENAFAVISSNYKGNGGTALSMMSKTQRINIFIKTELDDTICSAMDLKKIDDQMIFKLVEQNPEDTAVIENASLLIK